MAIGAMTVVRKAGLKVPGDISVVGFDDIELASAVMPALTTVAQPIDEIAHDTTNRLIQRLKGDRQAANQRIILRAGLAARESTARWEK